NSLVGDGVGPIRGEVGVKPIGNPPYATVACMVPLSNGNYLVGSPDWNGGRGAVTWGNGSTGISGTISDQNSLVGSSPGDAVGAGIAPLNLSERGFVVTLLTNGNYVVSSSFWNGPYFNARGAVTWGNGTTGTSG